MHTYLRFACVFTVIALLGELALIGEYIKSDSTVLSELLLNILLVANSAVGLYVILFSVLLFVPLSVQYEQRQKYTAGYAVGIGFAVLQIMVGVSAAFCHTPPVFINQMWALCGLIGLLGTLIVKSYLFEERSRLQA